MERFHNKSFEKKWNSNRWAETVEEVEFLRGKTGSAGRSSCYPDDHTRFLHMVRTTRTSAFPLNMRAYPSTAFASW
jgi:hypothetical protein